MQKADHEDIPGSRGCATASQIYANETSQDPTRWGLSTGSLHPVLQLEGPSTNAGSQTQTHASALSRCCRLVLTLRECTRNEYGGDLWFGWGGALGGDTAFVVPRLSTVHSSGCKSCACEDCRMSACDAY